MFVIETPNEELVDVWRVLFIAVKFIVHSKFEDCLLSMLTDYSSFWI